MTSSRVQMRRSSRSSETSSTAVPPSRAAPITLRSDSLAATSTPTVGVTATSTARYRLHQTDHGVSNGRGAGALQPDQADALTRAHRKAYVLHRAQRGRDMQV